MTSVFVLLACALVAVQCAPLHGDELLQNIENAAQNEVDEMNAKTDDLNAQAKDEEAQIEANQQFAQDIADDVKKSTELLDKMNSQEEQTIADAEEMASDSEQGESNVADIEQKDADSSQLSDDIQETAETVDKQLRGDIDQLTSAGVGKEKAMLGESNHPTTVASQDQKNIAALKSKKKKAAMLGESQDFKSELAAEEETAKAEVAEAQSGEEQAEQRKAQDDDALNQMNQMAHDGMEQLTKSESQLRRDLDGHRDSQLEQDIEAKAEEIESLEAGAPAAEESYTADDESVDEAPRATHTGTMSPAHFAAPTLLGENQEPMSLDDAMAQAEAASDEDESSQAADEEESMAEYDDETAQASSDDETAQASSDGADAVNAAIAEAEAAAGEESAPEMEAVQDAPESTATGTGTIDGDLKAIDQDAKELKSYQEQSLKEIAQIKEPLQ